MTNIKIKRYADKENLKKLMKYSKDTFATQSEINEKFYTKEQIDTMLESGSGGTEGSDDTQGELSFYTAVERAPGYDGTLQINISEDSDTVEDE